MSEPTLLQLMQDGAYRWAIWPTVVLLIWLWGALYGWYARKKVLTTNWARYFRTGQAQIFHAFLFLGTGIPGAISLLSPTPTSVSVGGDVVRFEIVEKQFVSAPIDVSKFSRVSALARVRASSGDGGATIVVYGVNDSGTEGELFRFTPSNSAWTRCERLILTKNLRVVADFSAGTDPKNTPPAQTTTTQPTPPPRPNQLDIILYFAPKLVQPKTS